MTITKLLKKYPLVSDQVDAEQLRVILRELDTVIEKKVGGAVVEFGCYIGTTSLFIRRLLNLRDPMRPFHVYDSFAGLPPKSCQDDSMAGVQFTAGALAVSKKQFLHEFQKAHLQPPIIHKGWFADLTDHDIPAQIAFAFLDGDFYHSIADSLQRVLPRLCHDGTIIIDDYAREALPGVRRAVHNVLPKTLHTAVRTNHNLGVITLP